MVLLPAFRFPSVFAAILDDKKGGRFRIAPTDVGVTSRQLYWPDTNILVSRFLSADGVGEVIDFMPIHATDTPESGRHAELYEKSAHALMEINLSREFTVYFAKL